MSQGTNSCSYTYDENGLRLQKTVNNVVTDYYYNGKVLIGLVKGNDTLLFSYDAKGLAQAVNHNGTYYYYLRNGQGDIVKIIDGSGATVVEYSYDSWGKQLSCTGTLATTLGNLNPFRYRGYVYDEETQWYYLKSRYYDPETCRFISTDVYLSTGQGVIGHNTYSYCLNNPVNGYDFDGLIKMPIEIEDDSDDDSNNDPSEVVDFETIQEWRRNSFFSVFLFSKSKGRGKDSGFRDIPTEELDELYKHTPHGKMRDRLQRELKNRKIRNKQKRNSNMVIPELLPSLEQILLFEPSNKKKGEKVTGNVGITIVSEVAIGLSIGFALEAYGGSIKLRIAKLD